ncbi:unnamed protein product, partial [Musa acuminata subsp. burmannicoides]
AGQQVRAAADTQEEEQEEEDAAYVRALQLTAGTVLAMVLKVALELDLFEVIVTAGPGNAMSPEEIAARLLTQNPQAPIWVDRILRLLAANSIVGCTVESGFDGRLSRKYSMEPISKFFTKNHDSSFASVVLLGTDKVYMDVWPHVKDSVLHDGNPAMAAYGMTAFEYQGTDPLDICMSAYYVGGKERTEDEFQAIAKDAGFSGFNATRVFRNVRHGIHQVATNLAAE